MFRLFMCAVCQVEMKPGEGVSIHVGSTRPGKLRPWDGPFLCLSCQEKKEAMEGKRQSGGTKPNCLHYLTFIFIFIFTVLRVDFASFGFRYVQ